MTQSVYTFHRDIVVENKHKTDVINWLEHEYEIKDNADYDWEAVTDTTSRLIKTSIFDGSYAYGEPEGSIITFLDKFALPGSTIDTYYEDDGSIDRYIVLSNGKTHVHKTFMPDKSIIDNEWLVNGIDELIGTYRKSHPGHNKGNAADVLVRVIELMLHPEESNYPPTGQPFEIGKVRRLEHYLSYEDDMDVDERASIIYETATR